MPSDLLLLAVRYISNELPADESTAFESLLSRDQAAREAVAEAVELSVALASLPASSVASLPIRPRRRWLRPVQLGAAAACLGCAVGLALHFGRRVDSNPTAAPPVAALDPPQAVALAWSGLRQTGEVDLVSHSELLAWLDEPIASASPDLQQPSGASAVEDELLPRWLLEATSLDEASQPVRTDTGEN